MCSSVVHEFVPKNHASVDSAALVSISIRGYFFCILRDVSFAPKYASIKHLQAILATPTYELFKKLTRPMRCVFFVLIHTVGSYLSNDIQLYILEPTLCRDVNILPNPICAPRTYNILA